METPNKFEAVLLIVGCVLFVSVLALMGRYTDIQTKVRTLKATAVNLGHAEYVKETNAWHQIKETSEIKWKLD